MYRLPGFGQKRDDLFAFWSSLVGRSKLTKNLFAPAGGFTYLAEAPVIRRCNRTPSPSRWMMRAIALNDPVRFDDWHTNLLHPAN